MKILDTCFLIHLRREWVRRQPGPATRFLEHHAGEDFGVAVISTLEFLEGYEHPADGSDFSRLFPNYP